jgi:hypothetical protein
LNEGIDHIEDLSLQEFIDAIENIDKMIATDKLDGVNLWVGVDESGKLFASREGKNKKAARFYSQSDFADVAAHNSMRAAFAALSKNEKSIKSVLNKNDIIEVEILYGKQPNSIVYGKDNYNYIAFVRSIKTPHNADSFNQSAHKDIEKLLKDEIVTVKTSTVSTVDGETISNAEQVSDWKFVTPKQIASDDIKKLNLSVDIEKLKSFLNTKNKLAEDLGFDMSNLDVMKSAKRDLSDEKKRLVDIVQTKHKLAIKDKILNKLVRTLKPSLQDDSVDDAGVEGVVFLDPETQKQFKVVDKDLFTTINKFNYQIRNSISGQVRTDDPLATAVQQGGIFGQAKLRIAKLFNIDGFGAGAKTKKVLQNYMGSSPEETVQNFCSALGDINVNAFKNKIHHVLANTVDELSNYLADFKKNAKTYSLKLKNGKTIKYTDETINRTLLVFAETKKNIEKLIKDVSECKDEKDLVLCLFGAKIKDLHGEGVDDEQ